MTTRTITATLKRANDAPWAGAVITATLRSRFVTPGGVNPPDVTTVTTDAGGGASLILAVPDAGTAQYYVTLPNGGGGTIFLAAGATITLGMLLDPVAAGGISIPPPSSGFFNLSQPAGSAFAGVF